MPVYQSLSMALRGHFHKPFASLPADLQQRVNEDFFPWSWDGRSPRERVHRAKQWDYENDPARRELREGIEALTNLDSATYSEELTKELRGDYLPLPRPVKAQVDLPLLPWEYPHHSAAPPASAGMPLATGAMTARRSKNTQADLPTKLTRRDLLSPAIYDAQLTCSDPYDTPCVWAELRAMAGKSAPPFIGITDDGLKWIDAHDAPKFLSLKSLRDRLTRQRKSAAMAR